MKCLTAKQAQVVTLRTQGCTWRSIAEQLSISLSGAQTAHRAALLKSLRGEDHTSPAQQPYPTRSDCCVVGCLYQIGRACEQCGRHVCRTHAREYYASPIQVARLCSDCYQAQPPDYFIQRLREMHRRRDEADAL